MEQYLQVVGLTKQDTMEAYRQFYGLETDTEAEQIYFKVGKEAKRIQQEEGVPVKKGLYELLDKLESVGIKKAVASSSTREAIEYCLENSHILERMQYIVSAQQVKRGKPFPDVFLYTCQLAECKPEDAVVLEDSVNGLKAAIAAGIPAIAVPDLLPIPTEISSQLLGVVDSLDDVWEKLQ
jgi:HAD superfamily hydrolase (TIGR01509 family)